MLSKLLNDKDIVSDLMGREYEEGATGPKKFDCYSLAALVRERAGLYFPGHQTGNEDSKVIEHEKKEAKKLSQPSPYCIVTFYSLGRYAAHVGIVLPCLKKFIHIVKNQNVSIMRLDSVVWRTRIQGYYEYIADNSIQPL